VEEGADQDTAAKPGRAAANTAVGASGTDTDGAGGGGGGGAAGVAVGVFDTAPVLTLLIAETRKVYTVPFVKEPTVAPVVDDAVWVNVDQDPPEG